MASRSPLFASSAFDSSRSAGSRPKDPRSTGSRPRGSRSAGFPSAGPTLRPRATHDAGYAALFSHPWLVRDLLLAFVPDDWLHRLDFATLETFPTTYATDDGGSKRTSDIVWRLRAEGRWLYLLIEFQSRPDPYMAVRVVVYTGLLYQHLIIGKRVRAGQRLPPVLPIVLYNGPARWRAAREIGELVATPPGLAGRFVPRMPYLLIDQGQHDPQALAGQRNLAVALLRIERAADPHAIIQVVGELNRWLDGERELRRTFAHWIRVALGRHPGYHISLPEIDDLQELQTMLSDRVKEWAKNYERQGWQKGLAEGRIEGLTEGQQTGQADLLISQITRRFGPQPQATLSRIRQASPGQLETWALNVLDADDIDGVFRS